MSLIFRTKMLHGKSGYFADSIGIGTSAPSGGLHISGGDIRVEGGDAYFENRPFVSGVPIMVQGDLFDIDTTSFYPRSNPSGFLTSGSISGLFPTTISGVVVSGDLSGYYPNNNPSGFVTGYDTGLFYASSNPSGFITGVDTSSLYPRSNPSGFIMQSQTGAFYPASNPSGFITAAIAASGYVASNVAGVSGAKALTNLIQITQSGYNAISSPSTGTLYIIVG